MKRRKPPKPDQLIASTEQGLAATTTTLSRWPVGGEMFFLTAPFRERWAILTSHLPSLYAMRYMMFIKHTEDYKMEEVPQSLFDAMGEFVGESMKNDAIVDTAGLQPTAKGKRVRLAGGKLNVMDGPFAETKEVIGGYALVEAKSSDEALALATRFMELHCVHWPAFEGECEVRPLQDMEPPK